MYEALAKRLVESALDLNKASDELNNEFKQIEKGLQSLNLGVIVWVPMKDDYELGYSRTNTQGWGIYVRRGYKPLTVSSFTQWQILSAPRQVKIMVVDYLESLLEAMKNEANRLILDMENAITGAKSFIKGLEK